jgi:Family of unknown function (DUF6585)
MSDGSGAPAYPHVRHAKGVLKRNIPYWVGGTFPLVLGIAATVTGITSPNAGDALPVGLALLAGTPFIFIPIFLELRSRPRAAVVTDRGLGWRDRSGDHLCPWTDVSALWRYDELGDRNARGYSKVVFADEQKVTFDQTLSNYETLAESVQTLASATLLPGYRQAVATGGAEFGPVTLRRDAIGIGKKSYPFDAIEDFTLFLGTLVIIGRGQKPNPVAEAKLHEIPNYLVLVNLLQELGVPFNALRFRTM